ncbi:NifU family protein [Amniculibacterium aquaticum]|uniref:NifU family protein n=1 Tax=Amniculibacterium aquaticum TaxID=2479858 RepID=UPI000F59BAB7|nr:NifU family protein [Amniculibacterium aquaticum]
MYKIIIEPTANPKVMKFVADYTLIPGSLELDQTSDLSEIPLAQDLLKFPFVEKVFITANFVAIAKQDAVEWEHVIDGLKNVIAEGLTNNPRIFLQKKQEDFQVFAEMTPNPQVMKFVSQKPLLNGSLEVKDKSQAIDVPIAEALYNEYAFVKEIFISDNFVAVTLDATKQWHEVMVEVRAFMTEYLKAGGEISKIKPQKSENPVEKIINREYTDIEMKIADILNEYVAPAVESDGGKISLIEFDHETKTAKMLMQGACSGCPSSSATLKNGIQNLLKQFLPDVVENVEAVNA